MRCDQLKGSLATVSARNPKVSSEILPLGMPVVYRFSAVHSLTLYIGIFTHGYLEADVSAIGTGISFGRIQPSAFTLVNFRFLVEAQRLEDPRLYPTSVPSRYPNRKNTIPTNQARSLNIVLIFIVRWVKRLCLNRAAQTPMLAHRRQEL